MGGDFLSLLQDTDGWSAWLGVTAIAAGGAALTAAIYLQIRKRLPVFMKAKPVADPEDARKAKPEKSRSPRRPDASRRTAQAAYREAAGPVARRTPAPVRRDVGEDRRRRELKACLERFATLNDRLQSAMNELETLRSESDVLERVPGEAGAPLRGDDPELEYLNRRDAAVAGI